MSAQLVPSFLPERPFKRASFASTQPTPTRHGRVHVIEDWTYLVHSNRASISDDVSDLATELLHRLLSLGGDLSHLNELLVENELLSNEVIGALLGL